MDLDRDFVYEQSTEAGQYSQVKNVEACMKIICYPSTIWQVISRQYQMNKVEKWKI